ncbi:MAG TPA: ribokinase [Bacteroides sp.]|nr:ribokinase [Bacteroides sp.]
MKKILVVGSSNTDLIIQVPEIPRPGETVLGSRFQTFPGGKGANQAVAAARAGGEVIFIAAVGDDPYGSEAVKGYRRDRINCEDIKVCRDTPSGIALISVSEKGENAISVAPGANYKLSPEDMEEAEAAFDEADLMLIQLEITLDTVHRAVEICEELRTRVILNPAPATDLPDGILNRTDIITPNEAEAERLTGIRIRNEKGAWKAAEWLHRKGVRTVIITLGARGAYLSDPATGPGRMIPGFAVNAVDTTAAGDVFNGQLAVALSEGKSLEHAIGLAHAAAALSVQKAGAQSSIPMREETDYFYQANLANQHTK